MRICKVCGESISTERLEALPHTDTCTTHSTAQRKIGFMIPTASKGCCAELMMVPEGKEARRQALNAHKRKR